MIAPRSCEAIATDQAIPGYTRITESNINRLGDPIQLRSGADPERLIHPIPLKPLGVGYEAGRLLLRVMGYADYALEQPFATTVDMASLAGIRVTKIPEAGLVMAFYYDKQLTGVGSAERLFKPAELYHGVHPGHMGQPDVGVSPEKPGFYIVGEQFAATGEPEGSRNFPLGRIAGLMGDPLDPAFREELGLY